MLIEQKPIQNKHHRQNHVEHHAPDRLVESGVTLRRDHDVIHHKGQKDPQHTDELQPRTGGDITVILALRSLNQLRKHDAEAQVTADIGKVDIEIPIKMIVEKADTTQNAYQSKRAVDRLKDQLNRPVFHLHHHFLIDTKKQKCLL